MSSNQCDEVSINHTGRCPTALKWWLEVVEVYSKANLTKDTDRIPALAGLAELYNEKLHSVYTCGLWYKHLPRQLTWAVWLPETPSTSFMASSWSWASVKGGVHHIIAADDTIDELLVCLHPLYGEDDDPSRRSSYAGDSDYALYTKRNRQTLLVYGRLIPCGLSYDPSASITERCNPCVRGLKQAAFVSPDTNSFRTLDLSSNTYFCLPMMTFYNNISKELFPDTLEIAGLILEPTADKGEFKRFGAFRTDITMGRNGNCNPPWSAEHRLQRRVFLEDVEDELIGIEERYYLSYNQNRFASSSTEHDGDPANADEEPDDAGSSTSSDSEWSLSSDPSRPPGWRCVKAGFANFKFTLI